MSINGAAAQDLTNFQNVPESAHVSGMVYPRHVTSKSEIVTKIAKF